MRTSNEIRPVGLRRPIAVEGSLSCKPGMTWLNLRVGFPKLSGLTGAARSILTGVLIFTFVLPLLEAALLNQRYAVKAAAKPLLTPPAEGLLEKLVYDKSAKAYRYNQEIRDQKDEAVSVGAGKYAADLYQDSKQGITIYDPASQISVKFVPEFSVMEGREKGGHVIYPLVDGKSQLVYTIKGNGLKEDILVERPIGDAAAFSFRLELAESLEARLLDDGALGVFSADSALHGNISFGTEEDRAKVEEARKKNAKNNLLFAIPAPVIKDSSGKEHTDKAKFKYANSVLTVESSNLKDLPYPIAIDPSFVVISASDWAKGTNESNIEFSTDGIRRAALSGGSVATWATTGSTNLPQGLSNMGAVSHGGYAYITGGTNNSTPSSEVFTAPINANGTLGTFTLTNPDLTASRLNHASVIHNGYIYVLGGSAFSNNFNADYEYAKLNSDGTVGSWTRVTSNNFSTPRSNFAAAVYNGHLYIWGGCSSLNVITSVCNGFLNDVQYAKINSDGTLGSWTTSPNSFATARYEHQGATYDGRLYLTGGHSGSSSLSDVQAALINADGSIGTWSTLTSMPAARNSHAMAVHRGHLYVAGGNGGSDLQTVSYAQINVDGSLSNWSTTSGLTITRRYFGLLPNGDTLSAVGGTSSNSSVSTTEYAKINPAGSVQNWSTGATYGTARFAQAAIVYNNYLYLVGGCTAVNSADPAECLNGTTSNVSGEINYAPINQDGTIGSWNTTTAIPSPTYLPGIFVLDGYMYAIGGRSYNALGSVTHTCNVKYAPINSNGTLGAWTTSATRFDHAVNPVSCGDPRSGPTHNVTFNGRIYVIGGSNNSTAGATPGRIYHGKPGSNGDITSWSSQATTPYTTGGNWTGGLYLSAAMQGNRLYVTGGFPGNNANTAWFNFANDNSVTVTVGAASPSAIAGNVTVVVNGYIYVYAGCATAGGCTSLRPTTVFYAKLTESGDTAADSGCGSGWCTSSSFTTARYAVAGAAVNGRLYMMGGCNNITCTSTAGMLNDVQSVVLNNGGSGAVSSAWTQGPSLSSRRLGNSGSLTANGYVYIAGGCTEISGTSCVGQSEQVEKAKINDDGTIGNWTSVTSLPQTRGSHMEASYNGRIYLIGGCLDAACAPATATILYAKPDSNGNISSWQTNPTNLPRPLIDATVAVYNGYVYLLSVRAANGSVSTESWYARFNADGTIGAWTQTASSNVARAGTGGTAANGYVYTLGGCVNFNDCSQWQNRSSALEFAKINSDGSLGSFKLTNQPYNAGLSTSVIAINGFLYAVGGYAPNRVPASEMSIQYAEILPDGNVGSWRYGTSLPVGFNSYPQLLYNRGRLHLLAGQNGVGGGETYTYSATLNSITRTAQYARIIDTDVTTKGRKLLFNGSVPERLGNNISLIYGLSGTATPGNLQKYSEQLAPGVPSSFDTIESRTYHLRLVLDDTHQAIFPDGTVTSMNNFNFYYSPNPGKRLRGGKTFTGQQQQSLDASP